jgi:hypothetical protein
MTVLALAVAAALAWPLAGLASRLAARHLAGLVPAPIATIDAPAPNARVPSEIEVQGRAVHETIDHPLWMIVSEGDRDWEPEAPIDTAQGVWQRSVWLGSRKGTHCRIAIVDVPLSVQDDLRRQVEERQKRPPSWWFPEREMIEARSWSERSLGYGHYPPLPEGTTLVAFVDVTIADDGTARLPHLHFRDFHR